MKKIAVFICILAVAGIAFADRDDEFDSPDVKVKAKKTEKSSSEKNSKKDETNFKLNGIAETGVDVISRVNRMYEAENATEIRSVARGDIGISARPVKNVRAEVGIEYDKRDTFLVIDKFYGQYSLSKNSLIRAGIMKKAFGFEERAGLDERYFRSRSIIRDGIKSEGFLGHDLTLQYRRSAGKEWRFIGGVSMAESERVNNRTDTLRYFQNYSAQYRKDNIDVVGAAVVQHFHVVPADWATTAFAGSLSGRYSTSAWMSEAELTLGNSVNAKIEGENLFFLGVRAQEQLYINTGMKTLRQVIPLAEAALFWKDLDESGDFETQIRGGLTLGFAKNNAFQFRNTFGMIYSKYADNIMSADRDPKGETKVRRYRFDSVAVVIF